MIGIEWLELYIPETKIMQTDLAQADEVDPAKYLIGLGQQEMAFCNDNEDNISMYLTVVDRVLKRYDADLFGFLGIGTESIVDGSKSIKSFLLDLFGESKPFYGLDTYHACYGGTASLFHALTWLGSEQWSEDKPLALVVCGDIASFKNKHERCTGGAGAVAMVVSKNGRIIVDQQKIVHHMGHGWDFYKPSRQVEHPIVNGPLSIEYYLDGIEQTYTQLRTLGTKAPDIDYFLLHAPYNKLVYKGFKKMCELDDQATNIQTLYEQKVVPGCQLSKVVGNIYTGSLYMCMISLILNQKDALAGKSALLYSYGSGYMCSMFPVDFTDDIQSAIDHAEIETMLGTRRVSTIDEYRLALRQREFLYPQLTANPVGHYPQNEDVYVLTQINNGIRTYQKNNQTNNLTSNQLHIKNMHKRIEKYSSELPYTNYDWDQVINRCCENIVGYAKIPIGLCGPALIDNQEHMIPIATTEGALVASINRGAKLLRAASMLDIIVDKVGISRSPVIEFDTPLQLRQFMNWSTTHLEKLIDEKILTTSTRMSLKNIELKPFGSDQVYN